jgi:hypothetical protein
MPTISRINLIPAMEKRGLKMKPMHGQFHREIERSAVDKEESLAWLCSSGLNGETGSLITTAQDQAFSEGYH